MKFVNYKNLCNAILETKPCQHIIIDNFLNEEYINNILHDINKLEPHHSYYHGHPNTENTKMAFNSNLSDIINELLHELCSDEFIHFLEVSFGIQDLIKNNNKLEGAGIHKVYNNGFLTMHKDFNHAYDRNIGLIDRRLNLLLYMNPNWKEEYKGHLCLYDNEENKITKKILPILNRCIIFNTTDCIHGHPEPMVLDNDVCRQSIALYYYTKNTTGKSITGKNLEHVVWYSSIR
jgi:Rps23 Pro-64 3,4-dihydroxylase Tpa1-like proline 4-hydroxylase